MQSKIWSQHVEYEEYFVSQMYEEYMLQSSLYFEYL